MLYVTTRIEQDAFTAVRALSENRGPGGGFFVPMRLPEYDEHELRALGEKSFSRNVAEVINRLFNTNLDGWAIEFAIGRYPVKLVRISSRETVAETWHNPMWRFERLARGVEKAIRQSDQICPVPTDWLMIAARIAVLFGIFGELIGAGEASAGRKIDVALPNGNFSGPMSAWYARKMGLPIGTIICCCNENSGTWSLLHKGEIRTDAVAAKTATPECDYTVPPDLERLVFAALGRKKTMEFCDACRKGSSFYLEPHQLAAIRQGMYVSVLSQWRMEATAANLYNTSGYVADPYTALCYGGVIDYRSRAGEGRNVLILSEESPVFSLEFLAKCIGMSPGQLKKRIDKG